MSTREGSSAPDPSATRNQASGPESMDETLASLSDRNPRLCESGYVRGDVVGRYVVLEEIGRGAMGLVVAAYDPELDRKIALKLVRVGLGSSGTSSTGRARMIREAQAMAKLAHPNVVAIHDVGAAGDDVFIAMEFVDGGSLREWLAREQPSWQQIVELFVQAGEGLAAAHEQGIIHRDFKPDNVLVRRNGRVGVADFGLARRDALGSDSPGSLGETLADAHASADAPAGLTMTGATLGTPAYMAPEQHLGTPLDARCDQFAFCVALWEALAGSRPFAGTTLAAIALAVTLGERKPAPRDSPVPSKVWAALDRGLETDRDQRFASMEPLLAELRASVAPEHAKPPLWTRTWFWAGLVAISVSAAVIVDAFDDPPEPAPRLCAGAGEHMLGVWDPEIEAEARAAFERSGRSFAVRSFDRADTTLDRLHDEWVASHTAACEATRVFGEQSEDMLDRRMTCLAQRRGEIAAVSAALRIADPTTVEGVDGLLATIQPIADCEDLEQLLAKLAPPPPEQRDAAVDLRDRLADLRVRQRLDTNTDSKAEIAGLLAEAEALGYAPILAEALELHAQLVEDMEGPNAAIPPARRAMAVATESGHRQVVLEALILLGWVEGVGRADHELGLWLLDQAEAEARALGDPVPAILQIGSNRGAILYGVGQLDQALAEFESGIEFARAKLGDDHIRVADLRFNIGAIHMQLDRYVPAEQAFRSALKHYTALAGPDHPEVAMCHNNLSIALLALGQLDEAEQHARAAVAIWEADGGHSMVAGAYATLGDIAKQRGELELAHQHQSRAHALKLEVFGEANPNTWIAVASLAELEHLLGRDAEGRARYSSAIAIAEVEAPDHAMLVELRLGLARLEIDASAFEPAVVQLDAVEARLARVTENDDAGSTALYLGVAKLMRAELEHARGRSADARVQLDAAAELLGDADPARVAEIAELRAKL